MLAEVPQELLDERRRLSHDVRDEMWDGVLHMVPPPGGPHQRLSTRLVVVMSPIAEGRGLVPHIETGLFHTEDDYRVPDQLYCRPEHLSDRGVEGAELVIELRSKGDETYKKIGFYSAVGVREMIVIHPQERRVELLRALGGQLVPDQPGADGKHVSEVLGITLSAVAGKLEITWDGGSAVV